MDVYDLVTRFSYHKPSSDSVVDLHQNTRTLIFELVDRLDADIIDCQEKATAVRKMEEAMFWYNAAIARRMNDQAGEKPDGTLVRGSYRLEHADEVLRNVHDPSVCEGRPCAVHNKTDHRMRSFPQYWRADRGIMERTCPHGIGHPDPDERNGIDKTHGCDGCCAADVVVETYEYHKPPVGPRTAFCDSCGWWVDIGRQHLCDARA